MMKAGTAMSSYHHLTPIQRENLAIGLNLGKSISSIAKDIGVDKSTVSREVRRNGCGDTYSGVNAQSAYQKRREKCRRRFKLSDMILRQKLYTSILATWSPEQAVNRLKLDISVPTVYRAIRDGRLPGVTPKNLRHKGKRRKSSNVEEKRGKIPDTVPMDARPKSADSRSRYGHFEGDTVLGRKGGSCLLTMVDRKSRFLIADKLESKTADEVERVSARIMQGITMRSITVDNGKEFACHKEMKEKLGVGIYFAPPRQPWQRGTNENTNGLLREFIPKGKSMDDMTQQQLDNFVWLINNRPRKCLGWRTPLEVHLKKTLHLT
jgi:IS30 family transposase